MTINRSEVSRALAKAIAYKNVASNAITLEQAQGHQATAEDWAIELVRLLECADILKTD